jgi:hypothetical protein
MLALLHAFLSGTSRFQLSIPARARPGHPHLTALAAGCSLPLCSQKRTPGSRWHAVNGAERWRTRPELKPGARRRPARGRRDIQWKLYEFGGHYRRGPYGERYFHPAADGWYPERGHRSARPVLIDSSAPFRGQPLAAWPAAVIGEEFTPPAGRGIARLAGGPKTARCAVCRRTFPRCLDGLVISHKSNGDHCPGSLQGPGEDVALASWIPINKGLTPHGKRHGLKVWMDEDQIADVLKSERLGHDEPGMRGVYGHVSPAMRGH